MFDTPTSPDGPRMASTSSVSGAPAPTPTGAPARAPSPARSAGPSPSRPRGPPLGFALLALALIGVFLLSGCVGYAGGSGASLPGGVSSPLAGPDGGIQYLFGKMWGSWYRILLTALALGLGIDILAFLYGHAMMDDGMKAWAKRELVQLGYSVIILIAVLAVIAVLSKYLALFAQVSPLPSGAAQPWVDYVQSRCAAANVDRPCHVKMAIDYLQVLASATQAQMASVVRVYAFLSVLSSLTLEIKILPDPSGILGFAPFLGLGPINETLSFLFDLGVKNLMVIRFQQFFIDFLHLAFFPFFLTMGLALRSLYFTRRLGGLFIAIALGFYIVYPMMYVFFHATLYSFSTTPDSPGRPGHTWDPSLSPDRVGEALYPSHVVMRGIDTGLVRPVPAAPTYRPTCQDGVLQPWEECNEFPTASLPGTNPPVSVGRALTCPPTDAQGRTLAGREKDLYCDTNSCTCTPDRWGGFRDFKSMVDPGTGQLKGGASLAAMCLEAQLSDPELQAQREAQARSFIDLGQKTWFEKVAQGYTQGISLWLMDAGDDLLGFHGMIDNLAKLFIFSLLAPFIALMVTLAAVKALSPLLGGDVEIAGLTRLI